MTERRYYPYDAVFAITSSPDLAVQLTCEPGRWRVMVFDLAQKAAAIAEHYEASLAAAKRFVSEYVRARYGLSLDNITWKEALRRRGSDV